ncbi:MAG: hypothetical protein K2P26_07195 [Oscillospiraceae bacterium]|nr:hypothetical protein [Oscillospiraceae bacterium]
MIKMICGVCRVDGTLKRAADGPFSLPQEQEVYLVNAGVAEFVPQWRPERVATPAEGEDGGGSGETPPEGDPASTGQETAELQEGEAEAPDTLDIVNGHFTIESLMELSRADMEKLAADLGVEVKRTMNKSEIAALLCAVTEFEVQPGGNGEALPELGAEGPVE